MVFRKQLQDVVQDGTPHPPQKHVFEEFAILVER